MTETYGYGKVVWVSNFNFRTVPYDTRVLMLDASVGPKMKFEVFSEDRIMDFGDLVRSI